MRQAAYTELTAIIERTSQNRFLPSGDYRFLDSILPDIKARTLGGEFRLCPATDQGTKG